MNPSDTRIMSSPFPKSASTAGEGRIVSRVMPNGLSGLETLTYQYPLKLISPKPSAEQKSALVFLLSYGGGLVGGDSVGLDIDVRTGARLSVVTQGHTKIFKSRTRDVVTSQSLQVRIENNAGLCLLPDPVQPFESSVYQQKQIFRVSPSASLCLLDWVTQGRSARGEDWSFVRWKGRNEVWLSPGVETQRDRLLIRDSIILDESSSELTGRSLRSSLHAHGIIGTLILRGPQMKTLGDFFLDEFGALPRLGIKDFRSAEAKAQDKAERSAHEAWRARRIAMEAEHQVVWAAAGLRGCIIIKFGARTVEGARAWISEMLHREGTVAALFGDTALVCVT